MVILGDLVRHILENSNSAKDERTGEERHVRADSQLNFIFRNYATKKIIKKNIYIYKKSRDVRL